MLREVATEVFERNEQSAEIVFQWVVGDTRELGKNFLELSRPAHQYAIVVAGRLAAYAATFAVAYALLPEVDFFTILLIAFAGSLSVWVSLGVEMAAMRTIDNLLAQDSRRVGWNTIYLDRSGVTCSTDVSEDYTSWLGVEKAVERDGSLWLKTGPAHGVFIPRRVFASSEELIACQKLIKELRENPLSPSHLGGADDDLVMH